MPLAPLSGKGESGYYIVKRYSMPTEPANQFNIYYLHTLV